MALWHSDQPASSAALDAFLVSEDLVNYVASYLLPSRTALRSLCLVSKWWNTAFSKFLYSHIVFHDGNAHILRDPDLLSVFVSNPRLVHTKTLIFQLIEGSWAIGNYREIGRLVDAPGYGWSGDIRHWAGIYNDSIQKIVRMMPNIYRFEWENWPISRPLLNTLKELCPSLRDVLIVYPDLTKYSRTERFYRNGSSTFDSIKTELIPLPAPEFQNLRKLYLYEITGDLHDVWIPKIATILGTSRFLEELGLSLSAKCERQYALAGQSETFLDFFTRLVQRYRDQGGHPLRLRVLKLGYGVLLNTPREHRADRGFMHVGGGGGEADYLFDLVHRDSLEELHMDNDLDVGCALNIRKCSGYISWSTIGPSSLPNLKRFTFTSLSERSREWLVAGCDPAFRDSLAMGIGTEKLGYSYIDDHGTLSDTNSQPHIWQRTGRFEGSKTFFLADPNLPNLPTRSSTLLILKPCSSYDLRVLRSCTWVRTLGICLQKYTTVRTVKGIVDDALPAGAGTLDHLWIRVGMDYPLLNTQDQAGHRGNAVRPGGRDGALVDEQLYLHQLWRGRWAEMAAAVARSDKCPTRYLKVGHLAWRVLPAVPAAHAPLPLRERSKKTTPPEEEEEVPLEGAKRIGVARLEPLERWDDETECPAVFRYNDPVRKGNSY